MWKSNIDHLSTFVNGKIPWFGHLYCWGLHPFPWSTLLNERQVLPSALAAQWPQQISYRCPCPPAGSQEPEKSKLSINAVENVYIAQCKGVRVFILPWPEGFYFAIVTQWHAYYTVTQEINMLTYLQLFKIKSHPSLLDIPTLNI